ncbi:MAG: hypothetical protein ACRDSR_19395 [Pseudonocardiaceae bacterium]
MPRSAVGRLRFEWLLPGHGDRKRLPAEEMARRQRELALRTQELRPRPVDFSAIRPTALADPARHRSAG